MIERPPRTEVELYFKIKELFQELQKAGDVGKKDVKAGEQLALRVRAELKAAFSELHRHYNVAVSEKEQTDKGKTPFQVWLTRMNARNVPN